MSAAISVAIAEKDALHSAADDAVYAEIESLLCDGIPRSGCIELAQALEDVMRLLAPPPAGFSDTRSGLSPMGAATAHR